ncbi:MAG TPA: hypothetical protein VHS58_10445 [Acetobacteraceae bacterium]|jgi:hypothetical protein|nr:hypothetical protein [Acetobacteraceae bacterium]
MNHLRLKATAVTVVASLLAGATAHAQVWPLNIRQSRLPLPDLSSAGEASKPLYQSPDAKPGQTATWTTPENGDSGTATLVEALRMQGMPCRKIRYDFVTGPSKAKRTYTVNWCHTDAGEWRILS